MGKSLGNFITLDEFFEGTHPNLQQAFSPMTIRFFILQAHYRSTLDFSNEALQAAEKGLNKLFETYRTLVDLKPTSNSTNEEVEKEIKSLFQQSSNALNDDFNSPMVIANLFDASRIINTVKAGNQTISQENKNTCLHLFDTFLFDILGLKQSDDTKNQDNLENDLMQIILSLRSEAKNRKDYATADNIRNLLTDIGITIKDTKEGVEWSK
jgi:cysteinyl-tRNA synthetase